MFTIELSLSNACGISLIFGGAITMIIDFISMVEVGITGGSKSQTYTLIS